jgi:hypothetical protein
VTQDEWRVEVDLSDEEHGYTLGERLRAHDLDDEARKRLGRRVVVTRDGSRLYLYAADETSAREAERVARELLDADRLSGSITVTRWHPVEEEWTDASVPLPSSDADEEAELARKEASRRDEWEVHVELPSRDEAGALAQRLDEEGLPVHRLWRRVTVDAPSSERADELVERLRGELPAGVEIWAEPSPEGLPSPVFVYFGSRL